ncbi:MAG: 1,4-alpha-glucan branching protein domain-containing protein [Myxococcota bacterium]
MNGRVVWVFHAHLPFVRHPEHPRFFEEDWLFEAIETCYLPLYSVLDGWRRDGVPARVTMSISPTLCAMWQDDLLKERFRAYLDRRSAIWGEERARVPPSWRPWVDAERNRIGEMRRLFEGLGGDLVAAFAGLEQAGVCELATTAATHALLPLFSAHSELVRQQVQVGVDAHRRAFGRTPRGFWLPECGWFDGVGEVLQSAGIAYTFVEGASLWGASPGPQGGLRCPVWSTDGPLVLGRDPELARHLWSRDVGIPGCPEFLDFHRDATFELSDEAVKPHVLPTGARVPLGLRHHRVTHRASGHGDKQAYDPELAERAVHREVETLATRLVDGLRRSAAEMGRPAHLVAPFDAELFGHWWREGPSFLDGLARATATELEWKSGAELLRGEPWERVRIAPGTWGESGDASVWLRPETSWMWRELLDLVSAWEAQQPAPRGARPLVLRTHAQLTREIFLAVASDWPFLVTMGTAPDYASARVREHVDRARQLLAMLETDTVEPPVLAEIRDLDAIFPWLDTES